MKAVFCHSNDDQELHTRVINNIRNLLDDDSVDVDSVALVDNSGGIRLFTHGSPHTEQGEVLLERGVSIKQCRNTLAGTDITEADLVGGVELVVSGIGELTRLRAEGCAYLKP